MKKDEISVEKSLSGFLVLSTIKDGQRIKRKYIGYTIKDAKKHFIQYLEKI